jgi:trehalose 6-phosphate synthase/phosphatase
LWAHRFIEELSSRRVAVSPAKRTAYLDFAFVKQCYLECSNRLILLDYDGTLTPIVKVPDQALPSAKMLKAMKKIVSNPNNIVFIISGRDQEFLDSCFGDIEGIGLSAEHGSFIKYPRGKWINLAADLDLGWKKDVTDVFNYYTERTAGK